MGRAIGGVLTVAGGVVGGIFGGPAGAAAGAALGGTVGGMISGSEQKTKPVQVASSPFDIKKEIAPDQEMYKKLLEGTQATQTAVNPNKLEALKQMGLAATGRGPSLAEAQLKAAQDRNLAQQVAAIQATRGGSAAANQRALLQNMGASGRDLAQQASVARLQERDSFLNQANLADQALRTDIAGDVNLQTMPKQALQAKALANAQYAAQQQAANAAANAQMGGALIGGLASVAGSYVGKSSAPAPTSSDEKGKKNIEPASKEMKEFLDHLTASKYEYKNSKGPGKAQGDRYGVMAQALEKSKVGKSMVKESPQGKMVDYGQGFGALLASQAELHKRLEKLEKKKS